jgi:hypothetical protein
MLRILAPVLVLAVSAHAALAGKLPKNAVELTAEEVKALYSDHSIKRKDSSAYFAPDGTMKAVYGKKLADGFYSGTWKVEGNEFCFFDSGYDLKSKKDFKDETNCYKWWKAGDKYWNLYSVRWDGKKPGKNDYNTTEKVFIVPGDIVGDQFDKLKKQAGM